ncbi:hypothetical protein P6F26_17690 [Roseibacterium sp. SDUM158017]|uniref:hypothetical protein n=1 Tax=Roseicyclus salinarum TaxID=3036773 RepID=UPI00241501CC|nr:hypothetical protein [Roseibacterium sp. SDUM158017]MDG4650284.1 hypothetical protein [Roseibacterium sp. SDUM158017]
MMHIFANMMNVAARQEGMPAPAPRRDTAPAERRGRDDAGRDRADAGRIFGDADRL